MDIALSKPSCVTEEREKTLDNRTASERSPTSGVSNRRTNGERKPKDPKISLRSDRGIEPGSHDKGDSITMRREGESIDARSKKIKECTSTSRLLPYKTSDIHEVSIGRDLRS